MNYENNYLGGKFIYWNFNALKVTIFIELSKYI